uniref:Uncharacterized protein n=1 Tax=viral metagenome TaxID=1070528 RepID=A0A6C0JGG3_9ZZZZ
MNDQPVPMLAYGLISITTLVLAYATFLDKQKPTDGAASPGQSSTSMLPNISALSPFSSSNTSTSSTVSSAASSITSSISSLNPFPSANATAATPIASVLPSAPVKVGGKSIKRSRPEKKHKKTRSHK